MGDVLDDGLRPYGYAGTFVRETLRGGAQRIVVPRVEEVSPGRYEAPSELSRQALLGFLAEFSEFLEGDGRHHIWVANPDYGTLVYDRHNVLYAYGPLDDYSAVLTARGLRTGVVEIPSPHWHGYHQENDAALRRLLARWPWKFKSLAPQDS